MTGKLRIPLLIFGLLLVFRVMDLTAPLSFDEGLYSYIGCVAVPGNQLPYNSVFDQKPILVYLPYYLACLFSNSVLALRLMGLSITFVVVVLIYYLVKKQFGRTAAIITILLELLLGNNQSFEGQYNLLSEQLIKLPLVIFIAWIISAPKRYGFYYIFLGGVILSWIFLTKQTYGLLFPIAIIAVYFLKPQTFYKTILALVSGFTVIPIAIMAKYIQSGALNDLWEGMFGYNFKYYIFEVRPPIKIWIKTYVARARWLFPSLLLTPMFIKIIQKNRSGYFPYLIITLLYLFLGFYSVWSGGDRFFGHYFQLISFPMFLLAGPAVGILIDRKVSRHLIKKFAIISVIILSFIFEIKSWPQGQVARVHLTFFTDNDNAAIHKLVKENIPKKKIFFAGYTNIYYFLYKLPLPTGNIIMSELAFRPNHQAFYDQFTTLFNSDPPYYFVIDDRNELNSNILFQQFIKHYLYRHTVDRLTVFSHPVI